MAENPYTPPQEVGPPPLLRRGWGSTFSVIIVTPIVALVLIALLLPAVRRGPTRAAREQSCMNDCRLIGLALQNYHDQYQSFPPAYTVDANGKPLHSWRTLLLPFMEQQRLYDSIDLTKPWDDAVNMKAWKSMPRGYCCHDSRNAENLTTYLAVVVPGSCMQPEKSRSMSEIADGPSSTILFIEVPKEKGVIWMAPQDADEALLLAVGREVQATHGSKIHFVFCDGSCRALPAKLSVEDRKAMASAAGKDPWKESH